MAEQNEGIPPTPPMTPEVQAIILKQCERYQRDEERHRRTIQVLVAAGFLSLEKYEEARALVESLP